MALIALRCPHCGGIVNMEDNLASGFCTHCGSQVVNEDVASDVAMSAADRRNKVIGMLRLAKHHLEDGDSMQASDLLNQAMMLDSANSDCWYMDAVIDPRNRENDIRRAAGYDSLGVFSRQDLDRFNGVKRDPNGPVVYVICFAILFFVLGVSLPLGFVLDIKPLLYVAAIVTVGVVGFAVFHRWKSTRPVE